MTQSPNATTNAPVAIITGAGRGLGRSHALTLARSGWSVVVNDADTSIAGTPLAGADVGAAAVVVAEIEQTAGTALANTERVVDWDAAGRLVDETLAQFGRLDAVICNAGTLLDRHLIEMAQDDFEAVTAVNLTGNAAMLHHVGRHWQHVATSSGAPSGGRVVLTSSTAAIWPEAGRANYNAAKAGVIALGRSAALEFAAFGATVNVITPYARSRMIVSLDPDLATVPNLYDPAHVSTLVAWLVSPACTITGQVLEVHGGHLAVIEPSGRGRQVQRDGRWSLGEIGEAMSQLIAR